MSDACTIAPSARNCSAMARPMPCPAAVTTAILSFSRPATCFPCRFSVDVLDAVGAFSEFRLDSRMRDAELRGEPGLDGAHGDVGIGAVGQAGMQRRHGL